MDNMLQIGPALDDSSGAIILLHGRGSTAAEIARLSQIVPAERIAWLVPEAKGGAWYPQRFLAPLEQNEPWLGEALEVTGKAIDGALAAGIPPSRIGLAGFSQGACLALEAAVRQPRRYGFVAALSGALIGPMGTPRPDVDLERTPVLLGCAEEDAHIPLVYVDHSERLLRGYNAEVTRMTFPGDAHTLFPQEIAWLQRQVKALEQTGG